MLFKTIDSEEKKKDSYTLSLDSEFREDMIKIENNIVDFYEKRLSKKVTSEMLKRIKSNCYDMYNYHLSEMSKSRFSISDNDKLTVFIKEKNNNRYIACHLHYNDPLNEEIGIVQAIRETLLKDYEIAFRYALLGEVI